MIVVKLMGGLGNQMFQYAAGRRLSQVSGVPLKLALDWFDTPSAESTPRHYSLHPYNIREDFATCRGPGRYASSTLRRLAGFVPRLFPFGGVHLREKHYHFDPSILTPRRRVYLDGYWQSEKYFCDIRDIICSEFTVRETAQGRNLALLEQLSPNDFTSVALHVRRGDYVADPAASRVHGACSSDYYADAVRLVAAQTTAPHFFIFSDDPEWVRSNLAIDHPCTIVDCNGDDAAHEDLRLMSMCRHHIIANSTFSWWGAWLCRHPEKLVIAPKRWFAGASHDTRDVVPASWVRI